MGMKSLSWALALGMALALPLRAADAPKTVRLDGYAEWRRGDILLVEGQRVRPAAELRFKGKGEARDYGSIPLGYEVKLKGVRLGDGSVLARELHAKPNGEALFESDLRSSFDEIEGKFRKMRRVYDEDERGRMAQDYGRLIESGPDWRRVRRIADDLVPPRFADDAFRVYVVDNQEWNAMAAPNGAIFVFSGLLEAMDDDEIAIVLGHELVHATHEHARKQFKKSLWVQLGALGVMAAAESIDSDAKRIGVQAATLIAASAWSSGYGRSHEDQADRVGLRYAFEGGYDVEKGPGLWTRFAKKYGEGNKLVNFFFSDHSQSLVRARNLQAELAVNYR
jgi:Zn-dependent protease with chaperone function